MHTPLDLNPNSRTFWGRISVCWRRPLWAAPSLSQVSPGVAEVSFSAYCQQERPSPQSPRALGPDPKWRVAPSSSWEVRTGRLKEAGWRQVGSSWSGRFWSELLKLPCRSQRVFSGTQPDAAHSCIDEALSCSSCSDSVCCYPFGWGCCRE